MKLDALDHRNTVEAELRECLEGSRGWVDVSHRRARNAGAPYPQQFREIAERMGLVVQRQGRNGYTAFRKATA